MQESVKPEYSKGRDCSHSAVSSRSDRSGETRETPISEEEGESSHALGVGEATFLRLGIDYVISPNALKVDLPSCRIKRLEGLSGCKQLKSLALVSNFVSKIENLEDNRALEELELYQNSVTKIEALENLTCLRILDLSFNKIKKIENLSSLVNLEELYLSSNKIKEIEGLSTCKKLRLLELGSNKIREIKGIDDLSALKELWLGKNKICSMKIPYLPNLKVLSLQSNRVEVWDAETTANCPNLTELFLSHNRLPPEVPEYLAKLSNLTILDLSSNLISTIGPISSLLQLQELWLNDNQISNIEEVQRLTTLKKLNTVYLERNPLQGSIGAAYRSTILKILPWLSQLDASMLGPSIKVMGASEEDKRRPSHSIMKPS